MGNSGQGPACAFSDPLPTPRYAARRFGAGVGVTGERMPTEIRILIADPALLFSLYRWLDADAHAHLDPGTRIALIPTEAITAIVSGIAGLRGLAQSYAAWRSSRRSTEACPVTFEATAAKAAVTVTEGSIKAIEAIAALVPE